MSLVPVLLCTEILICTSCIHSSPMLNVFKLRNAQWGMATAKIVSEVQVQWILIITYSVIIRTWLPFGLATLEFSELLAWSDERLVWHSRTGTSAYQTLEQTSNSFVFPYPPGELRSKTLSRLSDPSFWKYYEKRQRNSEERTNIFLLSFLNA